MVNGFTFWRSYYNAINKLNKDDKLKCIENMLDYVFSGIVPDGNGAPAAMFDLMKPNLDKSIKSSINGSTTYENQNEIETKSKSNQNKDSILSQSENGLYKVKDKVKDKVKKENKLSVKVKGETILDRLTDEEFKIVQDRCIDIKEITDRIAEKANLEEIKHPFDYFKAAAIELGCWKG